MRTNWMRFRRAATWIFGGWAAAMLLVGCQPEQKQNADQEQQQPATAANAHSHDHGDTGPHGGHLLHLEPSGAHAEWAHDDDTNTVTVFVDAQDLSTIEGVKFVVKIGDSTEEFALERQGDGWSLSSEALMAHLNMGEAAETTLVIQTADGEQSAHVEAHEHHHH